ncbi:hypothetical protein BDN72DRAFT_855358 [Pluteus cervinus]|uniref:Uncharacterized protein n=1 Tax=Pluteus cervinus TaxID=181527 RepID=A0ACD3B6Q9_9AGAR|nr:hypothetical protein BDN72DRAFT_855358 [Pluteus cervinus]
MPSIPDIIAEVRDSLTEAEVTTAEALTELDAVVLMAASTHTQLNDAKEKIVEVRDRLDVVVNQYDHVQLDDHAIAIWAQVGQLITEFNILRQATAAFTPPVVPQVAPAPAPLPPRPPTALLTAATVDSDSDGTPPRPPTALLTAATVESDSDGTLPTLSDEEFEVPSPTNNELQLPGRNDNELNGPSPTGNEPDVSSYTSENKRKNKRTLDGDAIEVPAESTKRMKLQGPGVRPTNWVNAEASTSQVAANTRTPSNHHQIARPNSNKGAKLFPRGKPRT